MVATDGTYAQRRLRTSVRAPRFRWDDYLVLGNLRRIDRRQQPRLAAQTQDDFHSVSGVELAEHGGELMLDRTRRARQAPGDLLVGQPLGDQRQHLLLVLRQPGRMPAGRRVRPAPWFRQVTCDPRALRPRAR